MAENDTLAGPGRNALTFVLLTVGIDAMGFGIIIPVMSDLIREVSGTGYSDAALWSIFLFPLRHCWLYARSINAHGTARKNSAVTTNFGR